MEETLLSSENVSARANVSPRHSCALIARSNMQFYKKTAHSNVQFFKKTARSNVQFFKKTAHSNVQFSIKYRITPNELPPLPSTIFLQNS